MLPSGRAGNAVLLQGQPGEPDRATRGVWSANASVSVLVDDRLASHIVDDQATINGLSAGVP